MTGRASSGADDSAQTMALIGDLRAVLSKLVRRLREQAQTTDLTSSQRSVLLHLEREGSATVTTLARAEGMRPQSMGATVSGLQAAGLISGAPHPNDGRQTVLSLTASCRKKLKASRAAKEDWLLHAIQSQLDAKEREKLAVAIELLRRLADS
jgi:DNA-binding MarR family transcriptional regulator